MNILRRIAAVALTFAASSAFAQNTGSNTHFVVVAGLTGGGDTIATANFTNGDSENINAGALLQFGAGLIWEVPNSPVAIQVTANFHVSDSSSADNGSLKFSRFPLEAIAYYTDVPQWRFGVGMRATQSPVYKGRVKGSPSESLDFKDAVGTILEAGYSFSPRAWVNVRYVSEKFQPTTYTLGGSSVNFTSDAKKVDGSHFGVSFLYQF